MGIPKFFHWISKKYGKTIEDWDENKTPFGLFIDLNGMIHPVVRGFLAENP